MLQIVDYISQGTYGLFEVDDDGETRLIQRAKSIESLIHFGSFAKDPEVLVSETCMMLLDEKPYVPSTKIFDEIIEKILEDIMNLEYNDEHEGDEWFGPEDENDW